jgi:hypothetical protein
MNRHHRGSRALAVLAFVIGACLAAGTVTAGARTAHAGTANDQKGRELVEKFLTIIKEQDAPGLRRILSPAFQLQRADGSTADRAAYLRSPSKLESYEIDDLHATRAGTVLVVRFDLVADSVIDGTPYSNAPAPRLAAFVKGAHGWQLVAYANFNVPAAEPPQ